MGTLKAQLYKIMPLNQSIGSGKLSPFSFQANRRYHYLTFRSLSGHSNSNSISMTVDNTLSP